MAEYRLPPAAERDLENIWIHTRRQWEMAQANRYIDNLIAVFADLAQSPRTAPPAITYGPAIVVAALSGT